MAPRKQHSFLLLEVLIAFALVAFAAPFLMKLPILHYRKQIERLTAFEKQRLADWTFSEVKELLLKQSVPWIKLPQKDHPPLFLPMHEVVSTIPNLPSKPLQRSVSLKCKREKEGGKGEIYRLYDVQISFDQDEKPFQYRLSVQRLPAPPPNLSQ